MSNCHKKSILGDCTNVYNNNSHCQKSSKSQLLYPISNKKIDCFKATASNHPGYALSSSNSTCDDNISSTKSNPCCSTLNCDDIKENSSNTISSNVTYENSLENDMVNNATNNIDCTSYTILNSTLNHKKKVMTDETKYKTELCKNWNETGKCNYGKKCKFAHGKHELNEKYLINKARYKSKKCNVFFTTSYCPYGIRCLFAHEQRMPYEINGEYYYQKYLTLPELRDDFHTENHRILPIFRALRAGIEINSNYNNMEFIDFNNIDEDNLDDYSEYYFDKNDQQLWEAFGNSNNNTMASSTSSLNSNHNIGFETFNNSHNSSVCLSRSNSININSSYITLDNSEGVSITDGMKISGVLNFFNF